MIIDLTDIYNKIFFYLAHNFKWVNAFSLANRKLIFILIDDNSGARIGSLFLCSASFTLLKNEVNKKNKQQVICEQQPYIYTNYSIQMKPMPTTYHTKFSRCLQWSS